jgi:hypothetical protein
MVDERMRVSNIKTKIRYKSIIYVGENTHMIIFLPLYLLDGPSGDPLRATG